MMVAHYEATLIIGHVGAILTFVGGYARLHWKFMKKLSMLAEIILIFSMEHEMLVQHLRTPGQAVNPEEWPTRKNKLLEMLKEFQK